MKNIMTDASYTNKSIAHTADGSDYYGTYLKVADGALANIAADSWFNCVSQNNGASNTVTYTVTFPVPVRIKRIRCSFGSFGREYGGSGTQNLKVNGTSIFSAAANDGSMGAGVWQVDSATDRENVTEVKIELTASSPGSDINPREAYCCINELEIYIESDPQPQVMFL